jgi:threonine dehydrogenase-like Zn-dependent dehydrogenase
VEQEFCYSIPEALLPDAALIELLAVAWHALKVPEIKSSKGKRVLIIGGGPIGIALIFALKQWGANNFFVSANDDAAEAK